MPGKTLANITRIIFILALSARGIPLAGQDALINVDPKTLKDKTTIELHTEKWRFAPGDNAEWAQPAFPDSNWQTVSPRFGEENAPPGWTGFGWFRIWIRNNDTIPATLGINLNHDGASEIYWDGRKVGAIGRYAGNAGSIQVARDPFTVFPVVVADTSYHLLAIRYANFKPVFSNFAGFQAWLGDMQVLNKRQQDSRNFYTGLFVYGGMQLILVLLHTLLFVFYPKQKVNLYYTIWVLVSVLAGFSRLLSITSVSPGMQYWAYIIFYSMLSLVPLASALLFYQVSFNYIPKLRITVVAALTVAGLTYFYFDWSPAFLNDGIMFSILINTFTAAVFLDGTIVTLRAIRRGNRLLWLIAIPMCIVLTSSIVIGSNMFGWFTLEEVMFCMQFVSLVLPVMFSVYLAINVARTNRSLEHQLTENKRLSDENLAQAQERNRLISEQAVQLEKTVSERTAEVRRQADRLREMDAAKSRFFVNLTHEFKTPLTLIMNPAKEILSKTTEAFTQQHARFIVQNTERLKQLINQLLDLSRLENDQLAISAEPTELVGWLRMQVNQYHSLAAQRGIELNFTHQPAELWIEADRDKMEKIVQNLLSNAFKFSANNGQVSVHLSADESRYTISIADNGTGIPPEKLPYIFDRFYQADASDTRSREGVGIGWALCRELATLLEGSVDVESREGEGTRFTLSFPLIAAPVGNTGNEVLLTTTDPFTEAAATGQPADELPLVLLAEDNADMRDFISLSFAGIYNIITAENGEAGVQLAREHIPLLVITDVMMPEMDGYQLCDALKTDARTSHIPIIMLTARADQDSRVQGIKTGADAYLAKPFDKPELLAVSENLIRTRELLRSKYGRDNVWLSGINDMPGIEQGFLDRVKKSIETHIDDPGFGADQLAGTLAMSRTQLHRKLKQLLDQGPGELVRTIRMQRAHELLQKTNATVAEVAYQVGYGNPANFSTSFSRHFGYPPSSAGKQDA